MVFGAFTGPPSVRDPERMAAQVFRWHWVFCLHGLAGIAMRPYDSPTRTIIPFSGPDLLCDRIYLISLLV